MNDENTLEANTAEEVVVESADVAVPEEVVVEADIVEEAPVDPEGNEIPAPAEDAPVPEPEGEVPPEPLQVGL